MIRRVYSIKGFDCAACASNSETHLGKHPKVESARIDYLSSRLFLTYKGEELTVEEILSCIHEVEEDPIEIALAGEEEEESEERPWLLIFRILYAVAVFFFCGFFFKEWYWVRFGLYLSALVAVEYDIWWKIIQNLIHRRNPLDEYLLIALASTGAFVLASLKFASEGQARAFGNDVFQMEEHFEAVLVCLLWQVGELLQDFAVHRSTKAIRKAVSSRVSEAILLEEGTQRRVDAKSLQEGDEVLVTSGMGIPVDGVVILGKGSADESSLTGESLPVDVAEGSSVYGGTLLLSGQIRVKASKDYASSSASRILSLIADSLEKKGSAEKFITKFARVYTPLIFLVAIAYIIFAGLFGPSWRSAVFTGLEIMVIACPCALVISVPLAYFAGIGLASKQGIVIKGASFLDALLEVKTVITDKTGTLSTGKFARVDEKIDENIEEKEFRTLLVSLESLSNHPLGKAIQDSYPEIAPRDIQGFTLLPGRGVMGNADGVTYYAGNAALATEHGFDTLSDEAGVRIYLFDDHRLYGSVLLMDEAKAHSRLAVSQLKKRGIRTLIYSGDKEANVSVFAEQMGVDGYRAGLLPEEKLALLEQEKRGEGKVCFLGDGVNDAPALARSDVGIAMGGLGAELAVEEADVLLLGDDPLGVDEAMRVARKTRNKIILNIVFALAAKVAVMVLAMVFGEKLPMEIAVLADTGVSVICILNSLLLLCRKA